MTERSNVPRSTVVEDVHFVYKSVTDESANQGVHSMNSEQVAGNWKQMTGKIKEKWGKLTDDDITTANGRVEILAGKLQERYGIAKEEAERQLNEFMKSNQKVRTA